MKLINIILLLTGVYTLSAQERYSKVFDPFSGGDEYSVDLTKVNDTFYIRAYGALDDHLSTTIARYTLDDDTLSYAKNYVNIQGGYTILDAGEIFLLSSEESVYNENISVSRVEKSSMELLNTVDLKISDSRYFNYTIKRAIGFNDKYFIGAQVLDSQEYFNIGIYAGYREKAVFFVTDNNLQIDTILIFSPTSGAYIKIEDIAIGPEGVLYISFAEKYLNTSGSNHYLEIRKRIMGFDQNYNIIFNWFGPGTSINDSRSCLTIGNDSTIYVNYEYDYQSHINAIDKQGVLKWECVLDSVIGQNLYKITKLIIAANGDIIGAGTMSSAFYELGESGFLFRTDSTGHLKWRKSFRFNKGLAPYLPDNFPLWTNFEDLEELPNGDLFILGWIAKKNGTSPLLSRDIWILRTGEDGCLWDNCPFIQDIITKDTYISLVNPENEWVVDYEFPTFPSAIRRYAFSADYFHLGAYDYRQLRWSELNSGGWEATNAFYREENGRIYRYSGAQEDLLMYDFDLGIGDTLAANPAIGQTTRSVSGVETSTFLDNSVRKVLNITGTCASAQWIEGMGDKERLFHAENFCSLLDEDGPILKIRCFSVGDELVYLRSDLAGCYTSASNDLVGTEIYVYPNPVKENLFLELSNEEEVETVTFYNNLGVIVLIQRLESRNTVDVSGLLSGYYIGLVRTGNGKNYRFKVMIKE